MLRAVRVDGSVQALGTRDGHDVRGVLLYESSRFVRRLRRCAEGIAVHAAAREPHRWKLDVHADAITYTGATGGPAATGAATGACVATQRPVSQLVVFYR